MTDQPADRQQPAGLANAQVTGGGGHEPDLDDTGTVEDQASVPAAGSGVDLKSEGLDERG